LGRARTLRMTATWSPLSSSFSGSTFTSSNAVSHS
jgi:hypothetical protein